VSGSWATIAQPSAADVHIRASLSPSAAAAAAGKTAAADICLFRMPHHNVSLH